MTPISDAHSVDTVSASAGAVFAAIDIGASSGRVIVGRTVPAQAGGAQGTVTLEVVHRFPNGVVESGGSLRWDFEGLLAEVLVGLAAAANAASVAGEQITSIGIDTWAVDYGLVNDAGDLVSQPFSYRDERTESAVARVHAALPPEQLYATTGLQFLPFNTLYQLASEPHLDGVQALLIPDLIAFFLTGERRTEATNASTTGLFDAVEGTWATALMAALELPSALFPPVIEPGEVTGRILPEIAQRTGLAVETLVVAVGSHDTASAVAAVPAVEPDFAYISSGTWSLVGVELDRPVLTPASQAANFTNERGVDGTIRYLRNVGGLWLLSECQREWAAAGQGPGLAELLAAAAALPAGGPQINCDDAQFIAPGRMPERIRAAARAGGQLLSEDPGAVARCIMDSLAAGYARTLADAERLAGRTIGTVHIVGGGSQNRLLCQLTADATGKPVVAGPVEATALGNVLVQARASGQVAGGLAQLRELVNGSLPLQRYEAAGVSAVS